MMINELDQTELHMLQRKIAYDRDEQSYKQLFLLFYKGLSGFAGSIVKSPESAEEIVSDVLMKVWLMKQQLADVKSLKVYLYAAIKNASLNYLVKHHHYTSWDIENIDVSPNLDLYNPEERLLCEELRQCIADTIGNLPPKCQMVYKLVREERCSYKEAAAIMDISENTVDRHLSIALQKLGEAVKAYLYTDK